MRFVSPNLTSSVSYAELIWDHVFIPSRNCPLTMFNENQNYSKRTLLLLIKIYMKVQYVTILMWQKMTAGEYNTVHGIHLQKCMMIVKENWEWNTWTDGGMDECVIGWMDKWMATSHNNTAVYTLTGSRHSMDITKHGLFVRILNLG